MVIKINNSVDLLYLPCKFVHTCTCVHFPLGLGVILYNTILLRTTTPTVKTPTHPNKQLVLGQPLNGGDEKVLDVELLSQLTLSP